MSSHDHDKEHGHRSRLEDEVIEILTRADRPPTFAERARANVRRAQQVLNRRLRHNRRNVLGRLGMGSWLLVSAVAAIGALVLADSSPFLARLLAIVAIAAFAVPIVVRWRHPGEPEVKRWRGKDVDFRDGPPDVLDEFRRRFRRPPKR